jgi:hypothetical protein
MMKACTNGVLALVLFSPAAAHAAELALVLKVWPGKPPRRS